MRFHTILTHESPDLDAIFCCYLLRRYGEEHYPGISEASIRFCPAGCLPDGKTSEELEREGIVAVDIGGGRFDTHPDGHSVTAGKLHLSAANLVAVELGVAEKPALQPLLEFVRAQDSSGKSLASRNPVDHLVSLPNLVRGGSMYFGDDFTGMVLFFMKVLRAIESACSVQDSFTERSDALYLMASDGEKLYLPPVLDFQVLFVAYLGAKILQKEFLWQCISPERIARQWDSLADISEMWGVSQTPELQKMFTFLNSLKTDCYLLDSNNPADTIVSLPKIIEGLYLVHERDIASLSPDLFSLLDCILAYERSWQNAVQEYKSHRRLYEIGDIKLVVLKTEYGAAVKVARWQDKADIVVFQDIKLGNISVSLNKLGRLKNFTFSRLSAKLRAAEVYFGHPAEETPTELFFEIGEVAEWFLHQSRQLLMHGSPKARRQPSRISFDLVAQLVMGELNTQEKLPDELCPVDHCQHHKCVFYPLRLPNCFAHRQALRAQNSSQQP